MIEESVHAPIIEITPSADKQTRAQSIHGRMAMGQVRFPGLAHWWPDIRDQILKFPHDSHDDFVDALAYIRLGVQQQTKPGSPIKTHKPRTGMMGELLEQRRAAERLARNTFNGGW